MQDTGRTTYESTDKEAVDRQDKMVCYVKSVPGRITNLNLIDLLVDLCLLGIN